MSLPNLAKKVLPWLVLAGALAYLGYTWNWALARASERHRAHNAFVAGTSDFIFSLCPATSLKDNTPRWASDMRGICQARQPTWGEQLGQHPEVNVENGSMWEALQLLSKLALEITPGKVLSLLTLVVISLAGLLGLQQKGLLNHQASLSRLRVTRRSALVMLIVVVLALNASLVLLNAQETTTMCQMTGTTYANLLSVDARCQQQTLLLHDTQAVLEQKKTELDARARELEDMKREIASLGAMRDALGTFKAELQNQSASTQQLIMAVTGATLDSITKTMDPLHKEVKGLEQSLATDFKDGLRTDLKGDMKSIVQGDVKAIVQSEVRAAVQDELKDVRRELREQLREDVRAALRSELQEELKGGNTVVASRAPTPSPSPTPAVTPARAPSPAPHPPQKPVAAAPARPTPAPPKGAPPSAQAKPATASAKHPAPPQAKR